MDLAVTFDSSFTGPRTFGAGDKGAANALLKLLRPKITVEVPGVLSYSKAPWGEPDPRVKKFAVVFALLAVGLMIYGAWKLAGKWALLIFAAIPFVPPLP